MFSLRFFRICILAMENSPKNWRYFLVPGRKKWVIVLTIFVLLCSEVNGCWGRRHLFDSDEDLDYSNNNYKSKSNAVTNNEVSQTPENVKTTKIPYMRVTVAPSARRLRGIKDISWPEPNASKNRLLLLNENNVSIRQIREFNSFPPIIEAFGRTDKEKDKPNSFIVKRIQESKYKVYTDGPESAASEERGDMRISNTTTTTPKPTKETTVATPLSATSKGREKLEPVLPIVPIEEDIEESGKKVSNTGVHALNSNGESKKPNSTNSIPLPLPPVPIVPLEEIPRSSTSTTTEMPRRFPNAKSPNLPVESIPSSTPKVTGDPKPISSVSSEEIRIEQNKMPVMVHTNDSSMIMMVNGGSLDDILSQITRAFRSLYNSESPLFFHVGTINFNIDNRNNGAPVQLTVLSNVGQKPETGTTPTGSTSSPFPRNQIPTPLTMSPTSSTTATTFQTLQVDQKLRQLNATLPRSKVDIDIEDHKAMFASSVKLKMMNDTIKMEVEKDATTKTRFPVPILPSEE